MLVIEDLQCGYGAARVLDGLDLELSKGEVIALLGRNGMGKTTLARAIVGMRPPEVRSGTIRYNGDDVSTLENYEIARRGVGYVPQGRRVFGSLTVVENLQVAERAPEGVTPYWNTERVFEFFPRLSERANQLARTLSGGEQQMLAIGRALITNPHLLLMDEPSEGLAPVVLGVIKERVAELKEADLTIFLIEQNLGLALSVADRMLIIGGEGKIAWTGSAADLKEDADAKRKYLGV